MRGLLSFSVLLLCSPAFAQDKAKKPDGNRLAYLDEVNPYYPHKDFPKLTTPMWVGDKDVEAVVILAIDDMRDPKKYEIFLRPILRRLKEIDGRAPVSIMTNQVNPKDPQLQEWLKEGLSLECHTFDHPCPFFKGGFDKAKETYDKCVDLMHEIPNNKPVAFRMPCCDSMNTPSPRFYAEIFNKLTAKSHFLSIDTSVFNYFTSADPELPKELVLDDKGQERFKPYLPADRSFVNTIENYPYPYVIGRLCWQFPCVTPSDWQAQHRQKPNNPKTVKDWKAALDCSVIKKGVFCLVFHPHGWIRNDQVVELIDHAVAKHGKKVKFLTFKEANDRLTKNLLADHDLRDGTSWILDANNDGNMDVVIYQLPEMPAKPTPVILQPSTETRIWDGTKLTWKRGNSSLYGPYGRKLTKFGVLSPKGFATSFRDEGSVLEPWVAIYACRFDGDTWRDDTQSASLKLLEIHDIDGDGISERIDCYNEIARWSDKKKEWDKLPFKLPPLAITLGLPENPSWLFKMAIRDNRIDRGLRFLDLNHDGKLDLVFSNEKEYGIYLFENMEKGWSKKIMAGKRADKDALPMISRKGTNNGFWVHSG
ncbi:MAG: polysaccharide deacetylase family protein, partial [Gemmataceae bacterium]|nr:polysaccharide deacetylase family protein [Gemmataceae bacterium]